LSSVEGVVNSAYAFLLVKYVSELEGPHRFLVLGFRDILNDLSIYFRSICKGDLIIPAGKLQEISKFRKTLAPCLIALDWEDVGKYASWTTSFKILDESPLRTRTSGLRDVHDPIDVTIWLSERGDVLAQVVKFISEKLSTSASPKRFENLKYLLAEACRSMQGARGYAEWFHPRKIIEAITLTIHKQSSISAPDENATVGYFLRKIGMEPSSEFDDVPFFGEQTISEQSFQKYIARYRQVLRIYLTSPYEKGSGRLRKAISILGLNLLRRLLTAVAEKEMNTGKRGKWTVYFVEFEQGKRERRTRKRKYDINMYGGTILNRSTVSGLPTRIQFVLERSKDFGEDNILPKLFKNELKALLAEFRKTSNDLRFDLSTIKMLGPDVLLLELLMEKGGRLVVDPYIEGSKVPIRKINELLSKLGVE